MGILKLTATGVKLVAAGALAVGGLYALGKSKDNEQSKDFASNVDVDIKTLLAKAGISELQSKNLFANPEPSGTLNENLVSVILHIRRSEGLYERTVLVRVAANGQTRDLEATRSYDSDHLPVAIVDEILKSRKSAVEWLIYSKTKV